MKIDAFYVDSSPVSVGAYRAFLAATNRNRPSFWALLEGKPGDPWPSLFAGTHDALPMTGISWGEARDYAEWRGVRLLSAAERDFAAGGTTGSDLSFDLELVAY